MSAANFVKNFSFGNHSDVGKVRQANEDYLGYFETRNGHLFVVCDGMGGHAGGATAAQTAVESIRQFFDHHFYERPQEALRQSMLYANQHIIAQARQNPTLRGMGTTCITLLIRNNETFYAHVGDSRMYLFSNGRLTRLTKDHSVVQRLVDQGMISEEEAEHHPRRNELMRALGIEPEVSVDVGERLLYAFNQDTFLLCTDGLTTMLNDAAISQVMQENASAQQKAVKLVKLANEAGGADNITVQVVQCNPSAAPVVAETPSKRTHTAPVATPDFIEEDMPAKTKRTATRSASAKNQPNTALILLGVLASIVLIMLFIGRDNLSDQYEAPTQASIATADSISVDQDSEEPVAGKSDKPTVEKTSVTTAPTNKKPKAEPAKTEKPKTAPKPDKASKPAEPNKTVSGKGNTLTHTVSAGETFSGIARRYNVKISTLKAWNPNLTDETALKAGVTKLTVKIKATHTVGPGDVLGVVSKKYGVDKELIMAANAKTSDRAVRGEKLIIPFADKQ